MIFSVFNGIVALTGFEIEDLNIVMGMLIGHDKVRLSVLFLNIYSHVFFFGIHILSSSL